MERKTIEQYRRELMLMYERAATRDPSYSQMARSYLSVQPEQEKVQPVFERISAPVMPPVQPVTPAMPVEQEPAPPEDEAKTEAGLIPEVFNNEAEASIESAEQAPEQSSAEAAEEAADAPDWQAAEEAQQKSGKGFIQVNVTTAKGTLPVQQAKVTISENGSDEPLYSLVTDESGKTETVPLTAPLAAYSETPKSNGRVFSRYQVAVEAPGYITTIAKGVTVFDGVTSLQPIDLPVALSEMGDTSPRIIEEAGPDNL